MRCRRPHRARLSLRSGHRPLILYDAPSLKARKLFILNQGYPVELVVTLEGWYKVRDAAGELAWVEAKNLSTRKMVDGQGRAGGSAQGARGERAGGVSAPSRMCCWK